MEGKETRFGEAASALFAVATTGTSTGAVNSIHDSFTGLGGGVLLLNMMLGEVAPGGVGAGLYGMLVLAVLTVFLAGLMVGRTPEYLGKKIGRREITLVSLYILTMPTRSCSAAPRVAHGAAGRPERARHRGARPVARCSTPTPRAANNNGSAFAGLRRPRPSRTPSSGWSWCSAGSCPSSSSSPSPARWPGRAAPPATAGTLPTHSPLFVGLLAFVVLVVAGLTSCPALALAPIAEGS